MKLLFVTFVIFSLGGIVTAQEDVKFRQEFDTWKTSVSTNTPDSKNQWFLMTKAIRLDSESATVKIGLFGILQNYEITVTPLKYEKDGDGKFVLAKAFDEVKMASKMSANKISDTPQLHTPTISLPADPEANALEIRLKTEDPNRNPQITINLIEGHYTTGKIYSVK